jgi:hypothetical protein
LRISARGIVRRMMAVSWAAVCVIWGVSSMSSLLRADALVA